MSRTPIWMMFEAEVLDQYGVGGSFSAVSLADDLGIDSTEASKWITNYTQAQRRSPLRESTPRPAYLLVRGEGRTTNAVWTVGRRMGDGRDRLAQFGDDVKCTMRRAVEPDFRHLAEINPRAAGRIDEAITPLLEAIAQTITAVMLAVGWDDTE